MTEKRFTYTTRIITDKKGYRKDYIWDNETLLHTEQVVGILNEQDDYINYVTKERTLACNKLDKQQATIKRLEEENEQLKKRLSLYDEDEVYNHLRTHPMPTTTITTKRKGIPLNMRHKRY